MLRFDLACGPVLQPGDIFEKNRACLVDSLDLQETLLGEKLVEKNLLSRPKLNRLQVNHIHYNYFFPNFKSILWMIYLNVSFFS